MTIATLIVLGIGFIFTVLNLIMVSVHSKDAVFTKNAMIWVIVSALLFCLSAILGQIDLLTHTSDT